MKLVTHYDLDGVVCAILLHSFIPNLSIVSTGYNRLNDIADEEIFNNKALIITDLALDKHHVNNLFLSNNKILWIDHHESSLPYKDLSNDKVKIYINPKFCGAGNVLKYFKDKQKFSEPLKTLTYLTNDYDMWQLKEVESRILNYIFWERKFNAFYKLFANGYDKSIVESFRPAYERKQDEIKRYLDSCDKYEFDSDNKKILLIFASKDVNDVTLTLPNYDYYFIVSDTHKISIRSKENDISTNLMTFEGQEFVESVGCHKLAGGINIRTAIKDSDELFDIYQKIIEGVIVNTQENKNEQ